MRTPFDYTDVATAQRANLAAGPTRAALAQVGPDEVSDAFAAALQQFVRADGSVHLDNGFRLVFARA